MRHAAPQINISLPFLPHPHGLTHLHFAGGSNPYSIPNGVLYLSAPGSFRMVHAGGVGTRESNQKGFLYIFE